MKIDYTQIVELSQPMYPDRENFRLHIRNFDVSEFIPDIVHRPEDWYILTDIDMNSHTGTHIEFPFHHRKNGLNALNFPIQKLVGPAVVLDFSYKKSGEYITMDDLAPQLGRVRAGDIVFVRTGMDRYYRESNWTDCPVFEPSALRRLIDARSPRLIGTDAIGFEVPDDPDQPNHTMIFQQDIGYVESLTNLDKICDCRSLAFVLPLPIQGADASPVRVIAVREGGITL